MCREVIYWEIEFLNYLILIYLGVKLVIKMYEVYNVKLNNFKNIVVVVLSIPCALLGVINYNRVMYSNFYTYVLVFCVFIIAKVIRRNSKISISIVAVYIFSMRLVDLWLVAVIKEISIISRTYDIDVIDVGMERCVYCIVLMIIYYVLYEMMIKNKMTYYLKNNIMYSLLINIYEYFGLSCFCIVYSFGYEYQLIGYWIFYMVCAFIMLGISWFYLIRIKGKQREKILNMRNDMMKEKYNELKKAYEINRMSQHDHRNHLIAISEFIKEDKKEDALNYLSTYIDYTKQKLKSIESGNEIVDIILNSKLENAKDRGINFVVELDNLDNVNVQDIDLCTLLGNLLDNAIEACEKVEGDIVKINLRICRRNEMLIIILRNSFHPSILKKKNIFKSDKDNSQLHGWGMRSIKYVLNKYDGTKEYRIVDNQIEICITVPI